MHKIVIFIVGYISFFYSAPYHALKAQYIGTNWLIEMEEYIGEYDQERDTIIYKKEPILLKKIYSDGSLHITVPCGLFGLLVGVLSRWKLTYNSTMLKK